MKDLKGREYVFLIIITLFYAALAFWNLGSHHIPSTGWEREERDGEIFLDLGEDCQVAGIAWFLGNYENREFELSWKAQEGNWIQAGKVAMENVYQWGQAQIRPSFTARYHCGTAERQRAHSAMLDEYSPAGMPHFDANHSAAGAVSSARERIVHISI